MELVFLLVLFVVVSLIQRAAQRPGGRPPPKGRRPARLPGQEPPALPAEQPQTLRDLFAEVRRQMEEAQRQADRERGVEVLEDEALDDVEERESLEVEPVVESLEVAPARAERPVVDLDAQADAVIRRRLKWAEDASRGRTVGTHQAFDARIRRPAPPKPVVRSRARELRQMVIWRELLDRPVALREGRSAFDRPE